MANPKRTQDTRTRTGWVWVIVGLVAIGLIVWWIAAAVDQDNQVGPVDNQPGQQSARTSQNQAGSTGGADQGRAADNQFGQPETGGGQHQASPSGGAEQQGGGPAGQAGAVAEFSRWTDRRPPASVDQNYVNQGFEHLQRAIGQVASQPSVRPDGGGQTGGGPSPVTQLRQRFDRSVSQLQQANPTGRPGAFKQAASNVVAALESIQQQAGLTDTADAITQLDQSARQIQSGQPLNDQSDEIGQFFTQSSQVLDQMARALRPAGGQPAQTGGGPTGSSQPRQPSGQRR